MNKKLYIVLFLLLFLAACGNKADISPSTKTGGQNSTPASSSATSSVTQAEFFGEKGEKVSLQNGVVKIAASKILPQKASYFNVAMPSSKTVYFFIVQDAGGTYRAAANACQVCHAAGQGFSQKGNNMICNTCGNAYPLSKIATEKGGCNPGPINPSLQVSNGQIIIAQADLAQVEELF